MSDLITNLHIQWPLLLAQIVNFLILLFLLGRFVYKPLIKLLNQRQEIIAESMGKSAEIDKKFKEFRELQTRQLQETRGEAQKIIERSRKTADKENQLLVEKTNKEIEILIARARQEVKRQKEEAMRQAESEMAQLLVPAVTRVLQESVDEQTHKTILEHAMKRIEKLYSTKS